MHKPPFALPSLLTLLLACSCGTSLTALEDAAATDANGLVASAGVANANTSNSPTSSNKASCPTFSGYSLTWSDEFTGTALDSNNWNYEVNCDGGGNNEDECYVQSPNNLLVQNDLLTIRLRKEPAGSGKTFTSSRITTQHKADFRYGKFVARLKALDGNGLWPAFWMMPTDSVYGTWPTSGEIDIMEVLGSNPAHLYGTPHFGSAGHQQYPGGTFDISGTDFSQGFHDFSVEWSATKITWLVDEVPYHTLNASDPYTWGTSSGTWPFDQKFFFILNLAVGGGFGGAVDPSITGADYQVQHVCAYQ